MLQQLDQLVHRCRQGCGAWCWAGRRCSCCAGDQVEQLDEAGAVDELGLRLILWAAALPFLLVLLVAA